MSNGDKNKDLSVKEYLKKIKPNLKAVIANPQNSCTWEVQLIIGVDFISSKENDEVKVVHSKSYNIAINDFW